jgi:hypothetical protein
MIKSVIVGIIDQLLAYADDVNILGGREGKIQNV